MKLDYRIRELIAAGSSVGANCHSCLEYHFGRPASKAFLMTRSPKR
jgi:alkylhydroperoxidase/carboxymuconolactone decarboxylase family protein YurZ